MPSRLSDCLVTTRLVPATEVRAAIARQAVYGGALDTALLELGTLDEPTLWEALGRATGLPLPPAPLYETPARLRCRRARPAWAGTGCRRSGG